jgi:4-amino-4-deoxy-L-arabinose transferase-like glycosyltransferase
MMVALLVCGTAMVRFVLSSLVPLFPDEAYYWLWSRRIEAGYFDHPPGVAWLIAIGTGVFGDTVGGVRFGPLVAALLTHVGAVLAAWQLAGRGARGADAAWRAAVLLAVLPMAMLGLVIATPDAALFVVVMLAVLAVERALASPVRSWRSLAWWTAAGLGLGLAFVSKYTAVLLPAGLVLAFALHPVLRQRFREAGPWWGSAIALALFSPVVAWNYLNEWISFRFQLGHGFGTTAPGSVLGRELELVGGQLGLMSPILFGLMMIAAWRAFRDGWRVRHEASATDPAVRRFALSLLAFVPLAFFAVSAVRRSVEPNWPALMYPAAILLLATETGAFARQRWWKAGLWVAGVILAVACVQVWRPLLPVAPRRDPIARAFGWDSLAAAVEVARRDPFLDGTVDRWVAAERYQEASLLTFYLTDHPPVFSLNLNGRTNQFDLWETAYEKIRPGDGLIAVFDDNPAGDALAAKVGTWFRETRGGAHVVLRRERGEVAHRRIWLYRIAQNVPPRANTLPALSANR